MTGHTYTSIAESRSPKIPYTFEEVVFRGHSVLSVKDVSLHALKVCTAIFHVLDDAQKDEAMRQLGYERYVA